MLRIAMRCRNWRRLFAIPALTVFGLLATALAAWADDGVVLETSSPACSTCPTRRFGAYQRPVEPVIVPSGADGAGLTPNGLAYGPNYGWGGLPGYFSPYWSAPYWSGAPYYGWRGPGWIPWGAGFGYGYRYAGFGYGLGYGFGPSFGYGLSYGVGPGYSRSLNQVFVPNPACPDCDRPPAQPSQPPQTIPPPPAPAPNGDSSRRPGALYY
jgi:hypothetical protein